MLSSSVSLVIMPLMVVNDSGSVGSSVFLAVNSAVMVKLEVKSEQD